MNGRATTRGVFKAYVFWGGGGSRLVGIESTIVRANSIMKVFMFGTEGNEFYGKWQQFNTMQHHCL